MAISTERLLKTEKKTIVLEALGDSKFSLSAQGIDKPITIMADEVFEVRANGKQLPLLLNRATAIRRTMTPVQRCYCAMALSGQAPRSGSPRRRPTGR